MNVMQEVYFIKQAGSSLLVRQLDLNIAQLATEEGQQKVLSSLANQL